MSKHTSGPWETSNRFDIYSESGYFIGCTCGNLTLPKSVELIDEANAKLIAAAPELLEACKEALDFLRICAINNLVNRQLKEAIEKAEGE